MDEYILSNIEKVFGTKIGIDFENGESKTVWSDKTEKQ